MAAPAFLEPLRPKPFRGDVIAAGVVVLTTLVWLLDRRFDGDWGAGVHLACAALALALVGTMAVLAPMEREAPRAYQSVLYVATVALVLPVLIRLADVLGAGPGAGGPTSTFEALAGREAGTTTWIFAVVAAVAFGFARARNSAVSTLIGALAALAAVLSAVEWILSPSSVSAYRWALVAAMAVFALCGVAQRDRRRRHGVAFVDAAGVAVILVGITLAVQLWWENSFSRSAGGEAYSSVFSAGVDFGSTGASTGWSLLLLAAGFGLIAYSGVDREPGPAYLGILTLGLFVLAVGGDGFLGWPLALLVAAVLLLAIGLRPTTPAPPPPDADVPPAPTAPLR